MGTSTPLPSSRLVPPPRTWPVLERLIDRIPLIEKEMLFVRRLVEPGWTCLDIGAAGGTYTHLLSRAVGAGGEVHAVEPRAGSMRHLRRLARWLAWDNVSLHQLALAAKRGRASMFVPRFVQTEAHLAPGMPSGPAAREEEVAVTTLDRLVDEHGLARLDLIACDVEGAELQVLAGAERTFERFRPVVVCEIEHRHLRRYDAEPEHVVEWFSVRGYRAHRVRAGRLIEVSQVTEDENDYVLWPEERPRDGYTGTTSS